MRFPNFRELVQFVSIEYNTLIRELNAGLSKLNFSDNFESFELVASWSAGEEKAISNRLNVIPSKYLIAKATGTGLVDGVTTWDLNTLYVKNSSGTPIKATLVFLK